MTTPVVTCSACSKSFAPQFRYQVMRDEQGTQRFVCSQPCHAALVANAAGQTCEVCAHEFRLEFPFQMFHEQGAQHFVCSMACRKSFGGTQHGRPGARAEKKSVEAPKERKRPWRIAVFNHKGGTGKTTTAVNVAAGLAELGKKVLLIDADGQGNVGVSLGIRGQHSLYHVLVSGISPIDAAVPVRQNLDVLTSNEMLAAAELFLASKPQRDRKMRERLSQHDGDYDVVVIDCAPALSLMNQNALVYADGVLVPVGCDYLSIVGVQQVLRTLRNVRELLRHPVQIWGVLPTFYDQRNRISVESVATLREHFGERCLPPVRVNTRLREAPSAKQTIFEYARDSRGAEDYRAVVKALSDAVEAREAAAKKQAVSLRSASDGDEAVRAPAASAAVAAATGGSPARLPSMESQPSGVYAAVGSARGGGSREVSA